MEQKKLIKEFLNKGWRLWAQWGLNKLLKKLQKTGTTAKRSGSIDSIQNIYCFLLCNIHTQSGYYKKGIGRLFANLLTTKITSSSPTAQRPRCRVG